MVYKSVTPKFLTFCLNTYLSSMIFENAERLPLSLDRSEHTSVQLNTLQGAIAKYGIKNDYT